METVTYAGREVRWAPTWADWTRAARVCREAGICGLDSEFHGVDLKQRSPAGRAVVDVWSLAVGNGELHPRGYEVSDGLVLPAEALAHPDIRDLLEDDRIVKVAHNARAEYHALRVAGVAVDGLEDSLELARWVLPERVSLPDSYRLKALAGLLGLVPLGAYKELFSEPNDVVVHRHKKTRWCECGASPCRRRGEGHLRIDGVLKWDEVVIRGDRLIPLETIREGHPKWDLLRVYAAEDAVFALSLRSYLHRVGRARQVPTPFARST